MNIESYIKEIQERLIELGYKERLISYEKLQILHQTYAKDISEETFAESVLQITIHNYKRIKSSGNKTRILTTKEAEIEYIKKILVDQGYSGRIITYHELQDMHKNYGAGMEEVKFAQEVLQISYANYAKVKAQKNRAKILKQEEISKEEILKIQSELKSQGYTGKLIEYDEFEELYKKYGNEMEKMKFAQEVLEMTYNNALKVKRKDGKVKILKPKAVSREKIKQMQNTLKEQGYTGKLLSYDEVRKLYLAYGTEMEEVKFAQEVLQISYANYRIIKNKGKKARVLNNKKKEIEDDIIEKIQSELIKQGYLNKAITYKELLLLYLNYGQGMEEIQFTQEVLEMSANSYFDLKNKGKNARILKEHKKEISKEEIGEIQTILKEQGYRGKFIRYNEFQELYKKYGTDIEEVKFAQEVLEISYANYGNIKNKGGKAKILKLEKISKEEIECVQAKLKEQGYIGKLIDYEEFKKLYQDYGYNMEEVEFAKHVLEISENYFYKVKNKGRKVRVKKEKKEISELEIEQIQNMIKKLGYDKISINYEELQRLYQNYGNGMGEVNFAQEVLGISYDNYRSVKNKGTKAKVLCLNKKISLIEKELFKESRYYTKTELENICKENNVSLSKLINQVLCKHSKYKSEYEALVEDGKVWIGRVRTSDEFIEANYTYMQQLAKKANTILKRKYGINYNIDEEDIIEDAILYVIGNRGDIEKNFEGNEEITKCLLYNSLRKYIQNMVLKNLGITAKKLSFNKKYKTKNGKERELQEIIPSTENVENKVLSTLQENEEMNINKKDRAVDLSEKCIEELKRQIINGRTREEALESTAKKLNLNKHKMIEIMQNHLISKGKVKMTDRKIELVYNDEER